MGYRDDFYKKENITGYTGTIGNKETVYFKKGNTFGRITQDHKNLTNIGREAPREAADYKIENSPDGHAREYAEGAVFHTSRNKFTEVTSSMRENLAKAIAKFSYQKAKTQIPYTITKKGKVCVYITKDTETILLEYPIIKEEISLQPIGKIDKIPENLENLAKVRLKNIILLDYYCKGREDEIKKLKENGF